MALPAGFVKTDARNKASQNAYSALQSGLISLRALGDTYKRQFNLFGAAAPSTPITLTARQRVNLVKYPGSDEQTAQPMGTEYEPVTLSGTIDVMHLQRRLANIFFDGDLQDTDFTPIDVLAGTHAIGKASAPNVEAVDFIPADISAFFENLRVVQQSGYLVNLTTQILDPKGASQAMVTSAQGTTSFSAIAGDVGFYQSILTGIITEVSTTDFQYGVCTYSITIQPVSPANTKSVVTAITPTKSALTKLKEFQKAVNDAIETVEEVVDTVNDYYNQYVKNSLSAVQQTMDKFGSLANGLLNIANLPAQAIQQVVSLAYDVKGQVETLASNALAVGSNYKAIGNIDMEWDGPTVSDDDKTFTEDPEQAALQVSYLRSGIQFGPDYDTTAAIVQASSLGSANDTTSTSTTITDFNIRLEQVERDRYIRSIIAPVAMACKKITDQYEPLLSYTTYTCRYGDTLRLVAIKTYGNVDKWRDIADFNGLPGDELTEGQVILLPVL